MNVLRHLLFATDFSAAADRALVRAVQLARERGARLSVLHVIPQGPLALARRFSLQSPEVAEAEARQGARQELVRQVEQQLRQLSGSSPALSDSTAPETAPPALAMDGLPSVELIVEVGRPGPEIAAAAARLGADLIILGAHGERFIKEVLLGSTVHKVLRLAPCPVLVVKQPVAGPYQRQLLPTDFSANAATAARIARAFAPEAEREFLHVYEVPFERQLYFAGAQDGTLAFYRQKAEADARQAMAAFVAGLGWQPAPATRLRYGYAPAEIESVVQDFGFDLIALASQDNSELTAALLGSVSLHVIEEIQCDLLVVRGMEAPD